MTPIAPLITAFLREYLPLERGYSSNTCETYAHAFRLLFAFVHEKLGIKPSQLDLEHFGAATVLEFLAHIEHSRKSSPLTRNARLAAIKTFMKFVELKVPSALQQSRQIQAIPNKRHQQSLVRHLDINLIQAILDSPNLATRTGIRDRAMLHLCFACGLRVSELVGLHVENVLLRHPISIQVRGKGRKERCLPLWKETAKDLRAWLNVRGAGSSPELFLNAAGTVMTRSGFEYILQKHVKLAARKRPDLDGRLISPHVLRHSCAVVILKATRDIRKVALWLGHNDMRTTEIYLRVDPTEKLETIQTVLPPSLRRGRFKAPDRLIASLQDFS
jgi:integrase/recombinase XerD